MFSKTVLLTLMPTAMAFMAGAVIPFQAASNAAVGRALGHPLWAALTSLTLSTIVIIALLLVLRISAPDINRALQGSWWFWIGGVLGAFYVGSAAALIPKLGAAGFLVLVVAGQILVSVIIDHFGWMGLTEKPLSLPRLAGIVLILGGVLLVQYTPGAAIRDNPAQTVK
ncbi:DMT family transporter [Pseudomonas ovata]|uniref:DMT family transporter n=1 Tax=Pseudomonas ovata TaxID=1839709 RepID=UPI000D6982CE|nr:DMT family transporter [Pseudomonas ovata]